MTGNAVGNATRNARGVGAAVLMVLAAGPAAGSAPEAAAQPTREAGGQPAEQVRARSGAYWDAMIAGEYAKAYSFLSPGFRARVSPEAFTLRYITKTRWDGAEIEAVECEGEPGPGPEKGPARCVAKVNAAFTYLGNELFPRTSGSTEIEESWIRGDGEWWLVPKR